MQIGGFMKQSFVDFPGTICAVIFTQGCNFNCWYCHNRTLIPYAASKVMFSLQQILMFLESRSGFLEGVVISGGEPTEQSDLKEVINEIKKRGFKVKLDTNGSNPEKLLEVLPLVDYVAMDIKNSFEKYNLTACRPVNIENIQKSINIIKTYAKDYEFRTTFAPDITFEDIEKIAQTIQGAKKFVIQTYNPQTDSAPKQAPENYEKAQKIAKNYIPNTLLR